MHGTGLPLVTPFDEDGALDTDRLESLVEWVEQRGVDFIVPCGSTSEAPLMSPEERTRTIETVAEAASVPVLAGTGFEGYRQTMTATEDAADVGADAALVVTPYYFNHDQAAFEQYYRDVADESPLPVYLYQVPVFAKASLAVETVERLADHDNVAGMKDSSGDVTAFQRFRRVTDEDFDLIAGIGSVYGPALDTGGDGGILALANIVPEAASAVYDRHAEDPKSARELSAALVELDYATTAEYGIPGLKAAMRDRGAPAGYPRRPFAEASDEAREEIATLVDDALARVE